MRIEAKVLASRQSRRKGNLYDADCPSRSVLDHITSRWGSLVLLVLLGGTLRFSELVRVIGGVSENRASVAPPPSSHCHASRFRQFLNALSRASRCLPIR